MCLQNSISKIYDQNGKYWIYTVLSNFYYILNGILFEGNSPLIKDVYCKLRACTQKKFLIRDINYNGDKM